LDHSRASRAGINEISVSDYALFFAYIQTEPKERTALWAGAKELAEVNGQLFLNFLEGMKVAGIKPKRVLLQTGGKVCIIMAFPEDGREI
jgi:hypothetical protein